jgi:hypothetical protein
LLASSARPALIKLFVAGAVRGSDCAHLPASTAYDYIEHTHEMSRVNGATNALSIGPSAGYIMFLVIVQVSLLFTTYVSSDTHMHIYVVEREMCPWAISINVLVIRCPTHIVLR